MIAKKVLVFLQKLIHITFQEGSPDYERQEKYLNLHTGISTCTYDFNTCTYFNINTNSVLPTLHINIC